MVILSSGRSIVLSNFPDFEELCVYTNSQNDSVDYHYFHKKRLCMQTNRKNELDLLQLYQPKCTASETNDIKIAAEKHEISRIRKLRIGNLYCVTSYKNHQSYEITLGMSNGDINFLNYQSNELVKNFPADNSKNTVISLDYNHSDEYLASVYENGLINIYGMKTKTKLETIDIDGNSTLARFHPSKRFHLSVVSYKGSVHVYDIQANRKIFQAIENHSAPCRDLAMSINQPDCLFSAGYDSIINIYDTRKKIAPQKIKCRYPLSTIAVSECGTFCCVGNLKGELISYDLRNLKKCLLQKKVHDTAVVRVSFIPSLKNDRKSNAASATDQASQASRESVDEIRKSIIGSENTLHTKRDSFCDYLDFHMYNNKTVETGRKSTKNYRESFDWEQLNTNKTGNMDLRKSNRFSLGLIKNTSSNEFLPIQTKVLSDTNSIGILQIANSDNIAGNLSISTSNLENVKRLSGVVEEDNCNSDKGSGENSMQNDLSQRELDIFLKLHVENTHSSTPNNKMILPTQEANSSGDNFNINFEILKQIKELRSDVEKKIQYLESEIKYNAECNKWNLFTQNCNFWNKQENFNYKVTDVLEHLLHSDDFFQEFCQLKEENEQLKLKITELSKNNSM